MPGDRPSGKHTCAAPGCERRCSTSYLMCRPHWMQVPRPLQEAIYATIHDDPPAYRQHVAQAKEIVGERIAAKRAAEAAHG